MAYQVLARKWRPQNFSSLVGQEPIVTGLRNALAEGRIAHAYLFSGIRGVGKTTAARVLAKALNCEHGPAPDPCNECTACVEIARGSDLDVLEVDAATYSKVEQVRELTESLRYGPARDRYKVVVLDEVHRLSRQAFDALLKIVEEPPPYLVFIFATTEVEAVPATILSRCQEFHFRRVPAPAAAALLRQICDAESIQASDSALRLVARAGEGSVRDAVALLDQLATFGSGTISDDDAVHLLGGLDIALFRRLLEAILDGDAAAVSREVGHIEDEGWDPRHVYGQFLAYCRDALHLALGSDPAQVDLVVEEARALAELARRGGYENLLRLLNQLLASEPMVRRTETGALAIEIAWLRAAELPKLVRVEELLAAGGGALAPRSPGSPAPPTSPSAPGAGGRPFAAAPGAGGRAAVAAPGPGSRPGIAAPGQGGRSTASGAAGDRPEAAVAEPSGGPRPAHAISAAAGASRAPAADPPAHTTAGPATGVHAAAGAAAGVHAAAHADRPGSAPANGANSGGPRQDASYRRDAGDVDAAGKRGAAAGPPPAPDAGSSGNSDPLGSAAIQAFLDEVGARKQPLAAHLEQAAALRFEAGRLLILLSPGDAYLSTRLRQPANRETVAAAVAKVWGAAASWDFAEGVVPSLPGAVPSQGDAADPRPEEAAILNPAVQTLLDIFGGKVEAVEEHRGTREE
jgi:DNA polymerase-3 subunit gamma/tau